MIYQLKFTTAYKKSYKLMKKRGMDLSEEYHQMSFFDMIPELSDTQSEEPEAVLCKIYNWRRDNSVVCKKLKEN